MINMKRIGELLGLVALAYILVILGAISIYILQSGESQAEIDLLKKRMVALEKSARKTAAKTKETKSEPAVQKDPYEDWLTYENTEIGYTLRYPADWTYKKSDAEEMDSPADYVVFTDPNGKYLMTFGLRKTGSDLLISGRTGLGEGYAEDGTSITVLGESIAKTYHMFENRAIVIFYGTGTPSEFTIGDNEVVAELGSTDAYTSEIEFKGSAEEAISDKIVGSLALK